MPVPTELRTARLVLRPWRPTDAAALRPVLEAEHARLAPWIPAHVATPRPVAELAERLAGFAADFAAARAWRYALFAAIDHRVLGEVSLFPRDASGRVAWDAADRVEVGYWLRDDATGQGLVTEAVQALLAVADALPGAMVVEVRCDERNAASHAVPRRLGFELASTRPAPSLVAGEPPVALQLWTRAVRGATVRDA